MPTHVVPPKTDYPNRAAMLRLAAQMAEEAEKFGARMRERREELGLTQRAVAERIPGKTEGKDISRYERGEHLPGPNTRPAIADALDITVADLHAGPVADRERPSNGNQPGDFAQLDGHSAERSQLDRIEINQRLILHALAESLAADLPQGLEDEIRRAVGE